MFEARFHDGMARLDPAQWDACAGDDNPFVNHTFLLALEESGSVGEATGWLPHHLTLHGADGALLGCAPAYLKSHSYGEYVFDWGWADAFERAGGRYYPKLQVAVPFTPATGPRLMTAPGQDPTVIVPALLQALAQRAESLGLSSVHITFPTTADATRAKDLGWLHRLGMQFHWENRDYADFEAFLASLSSRKRKAIRKERAKANDAGVKLHMLSGDDLTEAHMDAFFECYQATSDRKWGQAYLTRAFYSLLRERMASKVVLALGEDDAGWMSGAINLAGSSTLYGRNWGALRHVPMLHFEACYYRAIDWAITHGLKRVEAGAQGEHKIQRGYLPHATHALHWIGHEGLRNAVARFLEDERRYVQRGLDAGEEIGPYRKDMHL